MAIARGTKASGGTDFVTGYTILADEMNSDLNTIVSGVNNITIADVNVVAGANIDPSKIGDYSASDAEYRTIASPATRPAAATPTDNRTFDTSKPTDMEGELSRIRYIFDEMFGITIGDDGLIDASEWYAIRGKGVMAPPPGTMWPTLLSAAPTGWLIMNDGTIGNGSSSASLRANVDTHELFCVLYTQFTDAQCPTFSSAGAATTRSGTYGSTTDASAAWTANARVSLPAICGRVIGVAGTPRATNLTDAITYYAGAGALTTTVQMQSDYKFSVDDVIAGYTITITSGAQSGQTSTVTTYVASSGLITFSPAIAGAAGACTFTLSAPVTTRAVGSSSGLNKILGLTSDSTLSGSGDNVVTGFSMTGSLVSVSNITALQPTGFYNWMVKL